MNLLELFVEGALNDCLIVFPVLVFFGLLAGRRTLSQALAGAVGVLVGWLGILIGLQVVTLVLGSIDQLLPAMFERSMKGTARANFDLVLHFKGSWMYVQILSILLAYAVNIAWARFTRAKFIFVNPLHLLLGTSLLSILSLRGGINPAVAVLVAGGTIGSAMAWLPYLASKAHIRCSDRVALGSFNTILLVAVSWTAQKAGSPSGVGEPESTDLDTGSLYTPILFTAVFVGLIAMALAINAGEERTEGMLASFGMLEFVPRGASSFFLLSAGLLGFIFAIGMWLTLRSLTLVVQAVGEAFEGIARALPGCSPALDSLFMLHNAPRTAVIGFFLSLAGGVGGYYLWAWAGLRAVVPGMLVALTAGHLVSGGAAGIVALQRGGKRAMYICATVHGLLLSLLASVCMTASGGLSKARVGIAVELSDLSILGALWSAILGGG